MSIRQHRATRQKPCKICGKGNSYCLVDMPKGGQLCMNVGAPGSKEVDCGAAGIGYYYPPAESYSVQQPIETKQDTERPMAPLSVRNKAYSILLEFAFYDMSDEHIDHLLNVRKIPKDNLAKFGTLPSDKADRQFLAKIVADQVSPEGVPGFFEVSKGVWSLAGPSGILIPYFTPKGQIQAMQVRQDEDKTPKYIWFSSANTERYPKGAAVKGCLNFVDLKIHNDLWICEGGLKAFISAAHTGVSFCGTPGTGLVDVELLKKVRERCGVNIILCPDADFRTNIAVHTAWTNNIVKLAEIGIPVRVAAWDPEKGKGVDDYILNTGCLPRHMAAWKWRELFPLKKIEGWRMAA